MKMSSRVPLAVCLWLLAAAAEAQQAAAAIALDPSNQVSIPQLAGDVRIDGRLDDADWAQATIIDNFHQTFPVEFAEPGEKTEVRVFYSADALYVSARLYESDPAAVAARVLRQGQALGADDVFALILDPYLDRRNGYRFEVNPHGIRWEGLFQNINDVEGNWEGIWEAGARIDEQGWSVEMRIPFQTLSFNPDAEAWGINFLRVRRRTNENIAWVSRNREVNPSVAGTISGLKNLRQGVGLDVVPSLALMQRRKFGLSPASDMNYEPQLDMFYKVTPQLNASLTVNTDFSATEVDDRQVNLTRFNLFFPEKRDFFLRDVDIFEFGQIGAGGFNSVSGTGSPAAPNPARQNARPFFSRKIGLSPTGQPVDLVAGGKISGRVGRWNVGSLLINQGEQPGVDAQNIFVGRAVYNLGSRTQVGAIMTDGNPQSNKDNRLVGTDLRYRNTNFFGSALETVGFFQQSQTEGVADKDAASYGLGVVLPNAEGWQGLYYYKRVEDNFNPAVGFVNRTGIEDHHLNFGHRRFMAPGQYFRSVLYGFDGYRAETLEDGKLLTETLGLRVSSFTNTNDTWFSRIIYNKEVLATPFTIYRPTNGARPIVIPRGEYSYTELFFGSQMGTQRVWSGNLFLQGGEYYNGDHLQTRGNVTWRPNMHFSADVSFTVDDIELPAGSFILRQFGFTTQYAFSATLSWSNLIQYDNISENIGINSRLHWIPRAGQQAFLVLNWGMIDPDKNNRFDSTVADLSLKVNYTFRF